jgi:H+/Cl- antiporter ClcA
VSFGQELRSNPIESMSYHATGFHRGHKGPLAATSLLAVDGTDSEVGQDVQQASGGHSERESHIDKLVGQDALKVRTHMSHLFDPDPTENWAEESTKPSYSSQSTSMVEQQSAVNEDVVQTQSESAGSLEPIYEWVPWDRALRAKGRSTALVISILGSGLLAFIASMITRQALAAKGSGIPEVRATVAGFSLPKHFQGKTLLAKITGLSMCVGSGLAVGKEGPMIHIGACWGSLLAGSIRRVGGLPAIHDTELICIGAAAGVSAAFGAPLAGVLFAVEELGSGMSGGLPQSTMVCAFGSAVVASLVLKWLDVTRTQRLTLFEVDYKQTWQHWEAVWFCALGMVGGIIGGAFVIANRAIHTRRVRESKRKDCFCWFLPSRVDRILQRFLRLPAGSDSRVLEVVLLAVVTCISNFPRTLTRLPQGDGIFALFSQCHPDPANDTAATGHVIHDPIGLCATQNSPNFDLIWLLIASAGVRFFQTSVTFGALVPAGLFVPSLFIGGCVGRCMGVALKFAGMNVEPGIYGMVGAGAVLAGVSRLTISLVVVLFELTGGLTYVVPFMVAVLTAKWVGDVITDGQSVYDVHAEMNGMAKVEQCEDERLLNITMQDLRELKDEAMEAEAGTTAAEPPALWTQGGLVRLNDLIAHCSVAPKGFVVLSTDVSGEVELLGWADTKRLLVMLQSLASSKSECWCRLSASSVAVPPRLSPSGLPTAVGCKPWSYVVEDLSDAVNLRGATRIRHDCPIQTALCITQRCPSVQAFVSVDGPHLGAHTMSRENFLARLVSGRVRPLQ